MALRGVGEKPLRTTAEQGCGAWARKLLQSRRDESVRGDCFEGSQGDAFLSCRNGRKATVADDAVIIKGSQSDAETTGEV